jgi:hypothetical protein
MDVQMDVQIVMSDAAVTLQGRGDKPIYQAVT